MHKSDKQISEVDHTSQCRSIPAYGDSDKVEHWFPMRIAYDHLKKTCRDLKKVGVEYYMPVNEKVEPHADGYKVIKTPLLDDMIFVHGTKEKVTEIKHTETYCRYLRFITFIKHSDIHNAMTPIEVSEATQIITIPDSEMESFFKAMAESTNTITLIPYSETFKHIGRKIRILQGPLAGTICILRRIKNNKHVHIDVGGLLTIQLGYMHKEKYELIED